MVQMTAGRRPASLELSGPGVWAHLGCCRWHGIGQQALNLQTEPCSCQAPCRLELTGL